MPFFTRTIVINNCLPYRPANHLPMDVICLEDAAFYALLDKVIKRIEEKPGVKTDKWISNDEAMKMLRITSKTTLQKMRDEGKIRFSQPAKKIILYDVASINEYLNKHANETF